VLRRLPELAALERPVLVGPSRKSFIGRVLEAAPGERLMGTAAAVAAAVLAGAHVLRVHDVREMAQVARLADAIRGDLAPAPPAPLPPLEVSSC
jgi:dihydropteroate synthase